MNKLTRDSQPKFQIGQLVATPGALQILQESNQSPMEFIRRHIAGNWGDVCEEDKKLNDEAISHENTAGTENDLRGRVMSVYYTKLHEKLYVITEWDRSSTCLLLPSEY